MGIKFDIQASFRQSKISSYYKLLAIAMFYN